MEAVTLKKINPEHFITLIKRAKLKLGDDVALCIYLVIHRKVLFSIFCFDGLIFSLVFWTRLLIGEGGYNFTLVGFNLLESRFP